MIKYITDEQNKQKRVGKISISNCNSVDPSWAVYEVLAYCLNERCCRRTKNILSRCLKIGV
ncbi:TPA: hypothetical protein JBJ11_08385, partial [Legionella pneumophila]|nr:hypothetical protein [Legionella pneumophila]